MDTHALLVMVQLAIVIGVFGFVLADRLGIPAIVLLLFLGILVGPEVLGLINPTALGNGLQILVSTAVAIVVFEGGMLLDFDEMRAASPPIRNLMTIGVVIAVVGGTLAAWLIAGLPFQTAILFGALMSVTGPTVVTPLLKRANVNRRVQTILQSEAVLVDAIGAILSVVILEIILENPESALSETVSGIAVRLFIGTLVGVLGGYLLVLLLRQLKMLQASSIRMAALGGALAIYATAEWLVPESGIAAVALGGIVMGNLNFPYHEEVHRFKGDLTNLSIAILFIFLAATLRFETLIGLGLGGVLAVAFMMLVVRPASVLASTFGTSVPTRERIYISAIGPRGVVAASVATFAVLQLQSHGIKGADQFVGLVFMTIIATVVIQGLYAKPLARRLGVNAMHVVIVSADRIASELAQRLLAKGYSVILLDSDTAQVEKIRADGLTGIHGDGTHTIDLEAAGIQNASIFVAATSSDRTNMLACQIAMQRYGIKEVVARVNNPENMNNFQTLGIRVVSPVVSTAMLLDNLVTQSSALELLTGQSQGQGVFEANLQNTRLLGKPLKEWGIAGDVLVILARREGQLFVPHGNTLLQKGDILTLVGSTTASREVKQLIEGV
ncbi:MAG: cation:proton antiporter [Chloroflexota bacterium]